MKLHTASSVPDRLLSPLQLFHIWAKPCSRASASHRGCSHLNMHGKTCTVLRHTSPNQPCRSPHCAARRSSLWFRLVDTVQLFLREATVPLQLSVPDIICATLITEAVRVTVNWRCEVRGAGRLVDTRAAEKDAVPDDSASLLSK